MSRIKVKLANPYEIVIESGLLCRAGGEIRRLTPAEKAVLVTDSNVMPLYAAAVEASLKQAGFTVGTFCFPAGEKSKTLATVEDMLGFFTGHGLSRSDIVVALGGGVVGDMAGFAAAIYLRGLPFVSIPTSLLAQIDASVGGKTGCDLKQGKNLVGAFHQPLAVLIDPDSLNSLPPRYYSDGMAEAIKYGCIFSKELFEQLACGDPPDNKALIAACTDMKRQVVEKDEKDTGERMLLNFGHTLGHAIEKYYGFTKYSHGEAVSIGMAVMARAGERAGITPPGTAGRIISAAARYSLPSSCGADVGEIVKIAGSDKKTLGKKLNLILLSEIGKGIIYPIEPQDLRGFIDDPAWWRP